MRHFISNEMVKYPLSHLFLSVAIAVGFTACATSETHHSITPDTVTDSQSQYSGARIPITVGKFDNRSSYLRGMFSDGVDRLGSQAKTILITDLNQTKRFSVLDRDNMSEIQQESQINQQSMHLKGANYVVTGDVTEFGRKEVGDTQLFGILGHGKKQSAYAKVSLNIINVATSEVVHSVQGAGVFSLSNREAIGFGSTANYDATLNGKVLDLAIREAINRLTADMDAGLWTPPK